MGRLPNVGGDSGNWGTVLNDYLKVGHRDDGSLKNVGNVVNVMDYGAVGDGDKENPTDDTESINRAIAALENGSVLYFPAGKTFKITKALDAIGKERVHITGGGTVSAVNVSGYVFTIGSKQAGALQNCSMSHLRIFLSGSEASGVKWFHAQSFVMDNVHVQGDIQQDENVGVEVINGCYQGVIRHCKIAGRFAKGVWIRRGDEEEPFNVGPHGVHILGCWFSRLAPARTGVGLFLEGDTAGVRSTLNYYESWDTGIHVSQNATNGFHSISDIFEDNRIGINAQSGRVLVLYPIFTAADSPPEVGVDFSNGAYSSDGGVFHPFRNTNPSIALVRISVGCLRTRLEMEQALIDNNTVDNGGETVYYGQDKIRFGDVNIYRSAADTLKTDDKLIAGAGMGVGNSADATTLGAVKKKIEIFDASGNSLGFIPVYDLIS